MLTAWGSWVAMQEDQETWFLARSLKWQGIERPFSTAWAVPKRWWNHFSMLQPRYRRTAPWRSAGNTQSSSRSAAALPTAAASSPVAAP
jgi:hypothetical protein